MDTLIKLTNEMRQKISVPTINIVIIVGIIAIAISIISADEVIFKFKDLIEIILRKS